ncbi:hydroxyphenylacetyl-CoA thioesterase PaaI [Algihabitans albus]|uniref:hydroxyphenylacetyl-CoA thioesterase PaaI n=1 Tax=Algihabitans albus TaxID=2164067 RepID=UPI000E5D5706|nr:hydroxyphenylacetyl-CoA thioesterase PaaI [Algihabitans albus]
MTDPQRLAEICATAMFAKDQAARHLGITVEAVGPGTAKLVMTVDERMINGHAICHGGLIFTLADTAFAYACNAYNRTTVAQHCSVTFLAPAKLGNRLSAEAVERTRAGRNGIYDIRVTDQDGTLIAEFRGHSRSIQGTLVPEKEQTR